MTVDDCKSILFKLGIKYGIPSKLISERLLSNDDKNDMLSDEISFSTLDFFVGIWKDQGMCNYADGSGKWYSEFNFFVVPKVWLSK